ncbi:hypothetical protein BGX21_004909 [Mortierella sp. AD011]|nr:hypothetical protein BGX20_000588 [Mortierella sp. AD010]KAF9403367.1 hypothetical protein BGX21_004909 [Mortierella sp. AD011]
MLVKSLVSLALAATSVYAQAAKGKAFDHIFIIFLENTDFSLAASQPEIQALTAESVLLSNYHAVTHPSQPNYLAAVAGDYYGLNDDEDHDLPANYTNIVDLLEEKNVTWKTYQEDMPSVCYKGYASDDGLYFRKHNPFISHESISLNSTRCQNVVPSSQLYVDLNSTDPMPNYMFYTPNMLDDGHNTTVKNASLWLAGFLPPLMNNTKFINNTLVVLTFDETEDYAIPSNNVYTLLMGDAIKDFKNTTDNTFYTHYSLLSTVESNWGLGNLGRNDINKNLSNVFSFVANATGYENVNVTESPVLNGTEPGFLAPTSAAGQIVPVSALLSATAAFLAGAITFMV